MLPDAQHAPTLAFQCSRHKFISRFVPGEFCLPKRFVVCWVGLVFRTTVPEAAVYEDGQTMFREYKIWLAKYAGAPPPTGYAVTAK